MKTTEVKNTLGGSFVIPRDINEKGHVAGTAAIGESPGVHAFHWDGVLHDLGTLGGRDSDALAMNDRGELVGYSAIEGGGVPTNATLWRNGAIIDLGTLGGGFSIAADINNKSQVVGNSLTAEGETHAFLWQNGAMQDLGTLDESHKFSTALRINDRGEILGQSAVTSQGERHTFLWKDGVMTDLGLYSGSINERGDVLLTSFTEVWLVRDGTRTRVVPFGDAAATFARGFSNDAHVAGNVRRADGSFVSFVWHDGQTRQVGNIDDVNVLDVNRKGEAIGFVGRQGASRAFSWRDGSLVYLAAENAHTIALQINDAGQIMGHKDASTLMLWETSACGGNGGGNPPPPDVGNGKTW